MTDVVFFWLVFCIVVDIAIIASVIHLQQDIQKIEKETAKIQQQVSETERKRNEERGWTKYQCSNSDFREATDLGISWSIPIDKIDCIFPSTGNKGWTIFFKNCQAKSIDSGKIEIVFEDKE